MQALGPGAVLEEFERARRHAERDALGLPQFAFRQSEQPAGGERGGGRVADAGGMKAGAVEAAARHAGDPDRCLDAENIGGQHLPRRRPRHDRRRKRCRKLRHRRVDHAPEMGVVEIEAVADQAVDGRGVAAAPGKRKADDRNRSAGRRSSRARRPPSWHSRAATPPCRCRPRRECGAARARARSRGWRHPLSAPRIRQERRRSRRPPAVRRSRSSAQHWTCRILLRWDRWAAARFDVRRRRPCGSAPSPRRWSADRHISGPCRTGSPHAGRSPGRRRSR